MVTVFCLPSGPFKKTFITRYSRYHSGTSARSWRSILTIAESIRTPRSQPALLRTGDAALGIGAVGRASSLRGHDPALLSGWLLRWMWVRLICGGFEACRNSYGGAAALGRVDPVAPSSTLLKSSKIFSGSGKTMVVFFSTPISVRVWR